MAAVKGMFRRGEIWWLRYTVNGKQQRISLETSVEPLATIKAVQMMQRAPLEAGAGELAAEIEEYFRESLALRRLSPTCVPSRRYIFAAFQQATGIERVTELSTPRVEAWLRSLQNGGGRTPETVRSYLFLVRAFCTWLVKKNQLRENVAAQVELGKVERSYRKNLVSKEDVTGCWPRRRPMG